MRKFCVITIGRAGSTSLMDRFERDPDIAVPNKNTSCIDNEPVHPERIQAHAAAYGHLCERRLRLLSN